MVVTLIMQFIETDTLLVIGTDPQANQYPQAAESLLSCDDPWMFVYLKSPSQADGFPQRASPLAPMRSIPLPAGKGQRISYR